MAGKRILVVEDEVDLAELVAFNFRQNGYEVALAGDGRQALAALSASRPDLVILDVMLPDISGTDICRQIRKDPATESLPIVMVTARGEEVDRVVGFELGVDDYIVKPFSPRELVLRVQAVLRRMQASVPPPPARALPSELCCGVMRIDVERHAVTVAGAVIGLTALEFRLLLDLAKRRGRVQSRDALLERVWGYTPGIETRTVDTHVKRLREKLLVASDYIETVRGVGYRLRDDEAIRGLA